MGKETEELKYRIARYLYKDQSNVFDLDPIDIPTVEGERIPQDLILFAASTTEEIFEDCIAGLYEDPAYRSRHRFLCRRWKILDWCYGPLEQRLHRHHQNNYDDRTESERRRYQEYKSTKLLYKKQGKVRALSATHYNEKRLEELLPEQQWHDLQILKHGHEYDPQPIYDEVIYQRPKEIAGIDNPPPQIAEWLLSIIGGTTFGRNQIG